MWATSWGVSTRLMGGLIMTHSDDAGLVVPPKLASLQVVIIPIPKPTPEILEVAGKIESSLRAKGISVKIDDDAKNRPGFKFAEYELKGIPVRIGLGMRDLEKNQVEVARRDTKEKSFVPLDGIDHYVETLLDDIQVNLFNRAKVFRDDHVSSANSFKEFEEILEEKGGFVAAHWDGTTETELEIKNRTKATLRCIPNDQVLEQGECILTGKPSAGKVLFAKAY